MKQLDLPKEFDPVFYRKCKPYLAQFPDKALELEFRQYGMKSGAPGSPLCYRENVKRFASGAAESILEIGPGAKPDFTGENVRYLDAFTTEEMKIKYPGCSITIDYSLEELAEGRIDAKFDVVYSAHNFEHQVNPILHINSVARLLNPGGLFIAVIPDKNFTFDYFRETSSLTDILSAPDSQTRHTLKSRLERFNRAHNDCGAHWLGYHGEPDIKEDELIREYQTRENNEFLSLHAGVYEPESFRRIFSLLSNRKIVNLVLKRVFNTVFMRNEFVTIFQKESASGNKEA